MSRTTITSSILLFATLLLGTLAQDGVGPGCSATALVSARASTPPYADSPGRTSTVYDITVTTSGRCPATNIGLTIDLPDGAEITEQWNLQNDIEALLVENFGKSLASGSSFVGAGFIVSQNDSVEALRPVSVSVYGATCPLACIHQYDTSTSVETSRQSALPTSSPTSPGAKSTDQSSSVAASASSSDSDSSSLASCSVSASLSARSQRWNISETTYTIYDVTLSNNGSCGLTSVTLGFVFPIPEGSRVFQTWNLDASSGYYQVANFGSALAPTSLYDGAGLIVAQSADMVGVVAPEVHVVDFGCAKSCSA